MPLFESYVILDTTKTDLKAYNIVSLFESYVILDTTKTSYVNANLSGKFESYVIEFGGFGVRV